MKLEEIEKPLCLLDEETRKVFYAHGGPYQVVGIFGQWVDTLATRDFEFNVWQTYRVKPQPKEITAYVVMRNRKMVYGTVIKDMAYSDAKAINGYVVELTGLDNGEVK